MFSIIIPTFNNLDYLKICIQSIKKNSTYNTHEIIPHVNDGSDGTLNFLKENSFTYTHTVNNSGICTGMNMKCPYCYENGSHYHIQEFALKENHGPKKENGFAHKTCSVCMKNPGKYHYHLC